MIGKFLELQLVISQTQSASSVTNGQFSRIIGNTQLPNYVTTIQLSTSLFYNNCDNYKKTSVRKGIKE